MDNTIPDVFLKKPVPQTTVSNVQQSADSVIAALRPRYLADTLAAVERLEAWVTVLDTLSNTEQTELITGDFYRTAHDIKGQGATFGFPSMTELGAAICGRIKAGAPFTVDDIASFKTDIAKMRRVLEGANG